MDRVYSWNRITYLVLYCHIRDVEIGVISNELRNYYTEAVRRYEVLKSESDAAEIATSNSELTWISGLISPWDYNVESVQLVKEADEKIDELKIPMN